MNMDKELLSLITLNNVPDLGPVRINRLIEYFSSAENVLKASLEELKQVEGVGERIAKNILDIKNKFDPEDELKLANSNNTKIISYKDPDYPKMLSYLPDAPLFISASITKVPSDKAAIILFL